jgi:hypothetical protein
MLLMTTSTCYVVFDFGWASLLCIILFIYLLNYEFDIKNAILFLALADHYLFDVIIIAQVNVQLQEI